MCYRIKVLKKYQKNKRKKVRIVKKSHTEIKGKVEVKKRWGNGYERSAQTQERNEEAFLGKKKRIYHIFPKIL